MKTIFTLLLLAIFSIGLNAQLPADFELPEADTSWNQFANAGDAPENVGLAANPDNSGINTSDNCFMFTVLTNADPWAGAWSDAFGPIEVTEEKYIMQMMVLKDVATNCGLKLEGDGVDPVEVLVANTVVDVWELITFDFTAAIGNTYNRLVFFPDFPDPRTAGSICYIDNIDWQGAVTARSPELTNISIYPNPAAELITVQHPEMNRLIISNVLGQRIRSIELQSSDREIVEVSDLASGLYFITLETTGGAVTSRFIKE